MFIILQDLPDIIRLQAKLTGNFRCSFSALIKPDNVECDFNSGLLAFLKAFFPSQFNIFPVSLH